MKGSWRSSAPAPCIPKETTLLTCLACDPWGVSKNTRGPAFLCSFKYTNFWPLGTRHHCVFKSANELKSSVFFQVTESVGLSCSRLLSVACDPGGISKGFVSFPAELWGHQISYEKDFCPSLVQSKPCMCEVFILTDSVAWKWGINASAWFEDIIPAVIFQKMNHEFECSTKNVFLSWVENLTSKLSLTHHTTSLRDPIFLQIYLSTCKIHTSPAVSPSFKEHTHSLLALAWKFLLILNPHKEINLVTIDEAILEWDGHAGRTKNLTWILAVRAASAGWAWLWGCRESWTLLIKCFLLACCDLSGFFSTWAGTVRDKKKA